MLPPSLPNSAQPASNLEAHSDLSATSPAEPPTTDLQAVREALDALDHRLLALLAERSALVAQVGHWKAARGIPIRQPERGQAVYSARQTWGQALGLSPDYVLHLWHAIHEESCRIQQAIVQQTLELKTLELKALEPQTLELKTLELKTRVLKLADPDGMDPTP